MIKDKLGIGSNPAHIRSRSFGGGHEKHRERWATFSEYMYSYNLKCTEE